MAHFYHGHTRKLIAAFGSLFSNLEIMRSDSGESVGQVISVPCFYGPVDKYEFTPDVEGPDSTIRHLRETFPKISFELTGLSYAPERSRNIRNRFVERDPNDNYQSKVTYAPAPYDFSFSVYVGARNQSDALQVIEQILPFYQPSVNVTMKGVPHDSTESDVAVTLESVDVEDTYQGDATEDRIVVWTLGFSCQYELFGPGLKEVRTASTEFAVGTGEQSAVVAHLTQQPNLGKPNIQKLIVEPKEDFEA